MHSDSQEVKLGAIRTSGEESSNKLAQMGMNLVYWSEGTVQEIMWARWEEGDTEVKRPRAIPGEVYSMLPGLPERGP